MNMRWIRLAFLVVCVTTAHAAQPPAIPPSEAVIQACLHLQASHGVRYRVIATNRQYVEEDAEGTYVATSFRDHGQKLGYMQRQTGHGLIWGQREIALANAHPLDAQANAPSEFTPGLAMWAYVQEARQRYLCINFNFDGLGQSGSFQRVHGLYLMPIPASKTQGLQLFYGVRLL